MPDRLTPDASARITNVRRLLRAVRALNDELGAARAQLEDLASVSRARPLNTHEREVRRHLADRVRFLQREREVLRTAHQRAS